MPDAPTDLQPTREHPLRELAYATLLVALAVGAGHVLERATGFREQSLLFLTAVLFTAVRTRMRVSVYAAVLAFLADNFFFVHPRHSFYIAGGEDVTTVFIFLVVALVCGRLAGELHRQVELLRRARARSEAMRGLGQSLAVAADESGVAAAGTRAVVAAFGGTASLLPWHATARRLGEPHAGAGAADFDRVTRSAAEACVDGIRAGDGGRATRLDTGWWCVPLAVEDRALGALLLRFDEPLPTIPDDLGDLLLAMARATSQALARVRLAAELEEARVSARTERLRAALLSSVSHDLRSPLSTIIGSAESLRLYDRQLDPADRLALAGDIHEEGLRLDRYIQNLLDMTRIERGSLALPREWVGLDELVGAVLPRLRRAFPGFRLETRLPDPAPVLHVQPALFEQVLFNLLENAARHAPADAPVELSAARDVGAWRIEVRDHGPGIAPGDRRHVFEPFVSRPRADGRGEGTGLGLAICQGILAAHDGTIEADAPAQGAGAVLRLRLPATEPPTAAREDLE